MDSTPCDYALAIIHCDREAKYSADHDRWLCDKHLTLRRMLDKTDSHEMHKAVSW